MPRSDRAPAPKLEPRGSNGSATRRFRTLDPYRADREWLRYEGTPQRELFRELRRRFVSRHAGPTGPTVDLGSGPGRFTAELGAAGGRHLALDLSREMLLRVPSAPGVERVRGDAASPPLSRGAFAIAALLGNALGFAEDAGGRLLDASESLVAPGGVLFVEIAPASGERSRYLARLPASAAARLLRAPVRAWVPRVDAEGFSTEPRRRSRPGGFRRWTVEELRTRWTAAGWTIAEVLAVAPALGPDAARIEAVRGDPKAWSHLLDLEERLGRDPARWSGAAAVLLAAVAPLGKRSIM